MDDSPILDVSRKLLQHLDSFQEGKTSEELLKELNAIADDKERITFVKSMLKNFQPPERRFHNEKNPEEVESNYFPSIKCAIETHDLELALAKVNKGLAHIPTDQDGLWSQAISLRSEILLRMREFAACANDVGLALTCNPDSLESNKLKKKLEVCLKYMDKAAEDKMKAKEEKETEAGDSERELCELTAALKVSAGDQHLMQASNPNVPCASDALKLVVDPESKIRHFVAAREIKPGEILICEDPLVSFLNPERVDRCCSCMKLAYNLIPCDKCRWEMYCSEKCKAEAKSAHSKECSLMPTLLSAGVQFNMLNLMKLVLSFDINQCKEDEELGLSKPLLSSDLNSVFLLRPIEVENKAMLTLFFTFWAKLLDFDEKSPEFDQLVIAMGQLLPRVSSATFSIDEVVAFGGYLGEDTHGGIGLGVFPVTALVSHSCSPNSTTFSEGRRLIMQATRLISPGSLITQCFYPEADFLRIDRTLRQSILKEACFQYGGLECKCEACVHNWPTLEKLDGCDPQDHEVVMLTEAPLTPELLPHALQKAEEMELRQETHTKEFHLLQERIRMAIAKQGNLSNMKPRHTLVTLDEVFVD